MKVCKKQFSPCSGMTLTEVIIAIGMVAVLLPLAMTLLSQSFSTERQARDDLRASLIARQAFGQLEWVREEGRSEWFSQTPQLLISGKPDLFLSFGAEGQFLGQVSAEDWELGIRDNDVIYLVRVYLSDASGISRPAELESQVSQLNLDVGSPAGAPLASRQIREFDKIVTILPSP